MATLQQIVYDAFRELGLTEVGGTPDTDEYNEALSRLQYIVNSLFGYDMGENLTDLNVGSASTGNAAASALDMSSSITSLYVPTNVRLNCNLTSALTVYLHPKPRDGARVNIVDQAGNFGTKSLTLNGNGRSITINGTTAPTYVMSTSGGIFYRADLGNWTGLDVSNALNPSPFPSEFDDFLVLLLAKRLSSRYGATWTPELEDSLGRLRAIFRARYRQETPMSSEYALIRLPSNNNTYGYFGSNPGSFDKGIVP